MFFCFAFNALAQEIKSPFANYVGKYDVIKRECVLEKADPNSPSNYEMDSNAETIKIELHIWRNSEIQYFFYIDASYSGGYSKNLTPGNYGAYQAVNNSLGSSGEAKATIEQPNPIVTERLGDIFQIKNRFFQSYEVGTNGQDASTFYAKRSFKLFEKQEDKTELLKVSYNCTYQLSRK